MGTPGERDLDLVRDVAQIEDPIERARAAHRRHDQLLKAATELAELRLAGMVQMRSSGMSHSQIGEALGGLTRSRVSQIFRSPSVPVHRAFFTSGGGQVTVAVGGKLEAGRTDGTDQPVLSTEAMAAYQVLADLTRSVGLDPVCEVVPPPGMVDLNRPNLLVLTSPKLLPFVGQVLAADPWFTFAQDDKGWYLADKASGEEYRSPRDRGEPGDYAYLGRLPRPDGQGTFLYIAGIHATGTLGAAQYLAEHLTDLHRDLKTRRFSMLLSCRLDADSRAVTAVTPVGEPRIHESV